MDITTGQVVSLLSAAIGGGGIAYVLRAWIRREGRTHNTDYWYQEVTRLTERMEGLEAEVDEVKQALTKAQQEALFWRGQFYDEALSHKETRHFFSTRLLELKERGEVSISDIERIYVETVRRDEANRPD